MATAMLDMHWMIRKSRIEIGDAERSGIFCLCVVVFETEHPFASGRFRSTLAKRRLNGRDGAQIAVHHAEMHQSGVSGMRMGVDEAGEHGLSGEIHFSDARRREIQDVRILSNGEESAA